jgi:GNAT superfamily N-acetyltransferase
MSAESFKGSLEFRVTFAGPYDLETLVRHRLEMWREIHTDRKLDNDCSVEATREWIARNLLQGKLIGFVARTLDEVVVGSGCLWIREEQPRPFTRRLEAPYLMSMYTEPVYRRLGIAETIVRCAISWCKSHGYDIIYLHSSSAGRRLYDKLGFKQTNEMRLQIHS